MTFISVTISVSTLVERCGKQVVFLTLLVNGINQWNVDYWIVQILKAGTCEVEGSAVSREEREVTCQCQGVGITAAGEESQVQGELSSRGGGHHTAVTTWTQSREDQTLGLLFRSQRLTTSG